MEGTRTASAARDATTPSACSCCGAAVRDGAPWCTLCLTPTAPPPVAAPVRDTARPPVDPLTAPLEQVLGGPVPVPAGWPCTGCGQHNPLDRLACDACGSGFLARLAATDAPSLVLPLVGDLGRLGRGQLLALAGAVVAAVILLVVLLALLGLLLG